MTLVKPIVYRSNKPNCQLSIINCQFNFVKNKDYLFLPKLRRPIFQMARAMQLMQRVEHDCRGNHPEGRKSLVETNRYIG